MIVSPICYSILIKLYQVYLAEHLLQSQWTLVVQCAPPVISWFRFAPVTIDISTTNHSYWSYVHQLSYRKRGPHIVDISMINRWTGEFLLNPRCETAVLLRLRHFLLHPRQAPKRGMTTQRPTTRLKKWLGRGMFQKMAHLCLQKKKFIDSCLSMFHYYNNIIF